MKTALLIRKMLLRFSAVGIAFALSPVHADDGTWLSSSGGGNWSDHLKWSGDVIADGAGSTAIFQAANGAAGPYTINLDSDRTLGGITLSGSGWTAATGYTLSGSGILSLDGNGAAPRIQMNSGSGVVLTISAAVTGSNGLVIQGNNGIGSSAATLGWNPASMSLTGGITLSSASLRLSVDRNVMGSNKITLGGAGASRLFLGFDAASGTGTLANNIELANSAGSAVVFSYFGSSVRDINISGTISESGGVGRDMQYLTGTGGSGGGRFIVSGNNSYMGNTIIGGGATGPILVRATNNNALGIGTANVVLSANSDRNTLELTNNVKIENKNITLNGAGYNGAGSFNSISGTNEWAGSVNTGTTANATIGVAADTLKVSGVISGAVMGLTKVGAGTLDLAGENTYTTGTIVKAGTLLVSHENGLGSGGLNLSGATGITSVSIDNGAKLGGNLIRLDGSGDNRITVTMGSTLTTLSNNIDLAGNGVYSFMYAYFSNTQLREVNVTGQISESGGTGRGMRYMNGSSGAAGGRFIVSGNNSYTGSTTIGGGNSGPTVVRVSSDDGLGTGVANVILAANSDKNALELANNVKIESKSIVLSGVGYNGTGSLNSVSGSNEWTGNIDTGTMANATIGVASGSLKVGGVISGTSVGLTKVGAGSLELNGANNYTAGTKVSAGTLLVTNSSGAGSGAIALTGGRLAVNVNDGSEAIANAVTFMNAASRYDLTRAEGAVYSAYAAESSLSGGIATVVRFLDGTAGSAGGGTRTIATSFGVASSVSATNSSAIRSDVFSLDGTSSGGSSGDIFVLELGIVNVTEDMFLGSLDNTGLWMNAVLGNSNAAIMGLSGFQGDGAYDSSSDFVLGYWGYDTTSGTVWAVLDHDSEFAIVAVPEPAVVGLVLLALMAGLVWFKPRCRSGLCIE